MFAAVLLVFFGTAVAPAPIGTNISSTCLCGVFMRDLSSNETKPLLSQEAFDAGCNSKGDLKCQQICVALATLAQDKAPNILCSILKGHVEPFEPALFWRNCDSKWTFSGLAGNHTISCHDGKPLPCKNHCG